LASTATRSQATKAKKRKRTKGPSEKIRSLAALSLAQKVGYLKLSDLAGPDSAKIETAISERLPKRNFKPGDTIYPGSQKGPALFLVKSGSVRITRTSSQGQQFDVKTVDAGTVFGEMPMLGQTMLGAQAIAAESAKVAVINAAEFEKLASSTPAIALNVLRQIGPRLADAERRHEQAAFQPVTARIASLLLRLANKDGQVVGYTHQDMADMLGVYRETVTNAIAELKADRLIKVGRKRITIQDAESMRQMESV
jgi:CRP/FNR family cyclic AMP-dependent transcriptional regulator